MINWVSWVDICKSNYDEGFGMKICELSNMVLLSKWAWKFISDQLVLGVFIFFIFDMAIL